MRAFDKRFGAEFLASVPTEPGVYRFVDADGAVVYVGKARDLRRRLTQYRDANRTRKDKKKRLIVKAAETITFEVHPSDLEACLAENALIQSLRPPLNVAGAFAFLYPMIGVAVRAEHVRFCMTTTPDAFADYALAGAFRSREVTGQAFFALMRLLGHVGHPEPRRRLDGDDDADWSYAYGFRRLPRGWPDAWLAFLRGEDAGALGMLAVRLLEQAAARAKAAAVEDDLHALRAFWRDEVSPLRAAITHTGFGEYPVPQAARDPLFLRYRALVAGADAVVSA